MAMYVWDMGFNLNDAPLADNENLPQIYQGCVGFNNNVPFATGPKPRLNLGDTLSINVFNMTPDAQQTDCLITSYQITFRSIEGQALSPFSSIEFSNGDLGITSAAKILSVGIPFGVAPCYFGVVNLGAVLNGGEFFFRAYLTVLNTNNNKTTKFFVDPEMIAGGTN